MSMSMPQSELSQESGVKESNLTFFYIARGIRVSIIFPFNCLVCIAEPALIIINLRNEFMSPIDNVKLKGLRI